MKKLACLFLLFLIILVAGCRSTAVPSAAIETPTIQPTIQPTNQPTTQPTTQPADQPTATPPATATSRPTSVATLAPTRTVESATETPAAEETATSTADATGDATADAPATEAAPPPATGVEQPPYEASACSDKYPCNDDIEGWETRIRVPAGFQAVYHARIDGKPTSIAFGPDGRLYVATLEGIIYAVDDAGNVAAYVSGFTVPTGIAFQPGTSKLYVASRAVNQGMGGEARISVVQGGGVTHIIGGLPCCYTGLHSANGIAFGPDGSGYVGVGGRADHGEILVEGPDKGKQDELHPLEASILRFSPDGSVVEPYARGFRNPYDIAWDGNGQLYATDNAPDYGPPEEMHRVIAGGQHGYPWYDCDVCFGAPPDVQLIPPIYQFIPHSAPTGITAYLGNQFPGYYNSLFVVLWSSFPGAQKVMRFGPGGSGASNFATGFAQPIDVTVGPEGSLYVADHATGIIFRIGHTG